MKEYKYRLKDLSCANCAAKIESKVNKLQEVKDTSLNFVTKVLKVNVDDESNSNELFKTIKKIVRETEDGVEVFELTPEENIVCSIEGLDCANCAAKIEVQLNKTDGIEEARVDFLSRKLTLSLSSLANKSETEQNNQKKKPAVSTGLRRDF